MKSLTPTRKRNRTVSQSLEKSLTRYALATASIAAMSIPATSSAVGSNLISVGFPEDLDDFSGPYAPGNWTFSNTGSANPTGMVNTAMAPASITLTGGTGGTIGGPSGTTNFTIAAVASGMVSFNWTYASTDTGSYDIGNFVLNGAPTVLATNATQGSGMFSIMVNAGDIFGFQVFTADSFAGPGILTISNFNAPVPEGSTLGLLALGSVGILILMRRRLRSSA